MVSPNEIKQAEDLITRGFFEEGRQFFSRMLSEVTDPVMERIAENRLHLIDERMKTAAQCCQFDIESESGQDGFILCNLKFIYKQPHLGKLLEDLFSNSHKKNYNATSSITFVQAASRQIAVEVSGYGTDQRCDWCILFRKNFLHYIGKNNIIRHGHCPLGFDG